MRYSANHLMLMRVAVGRRNVLRLLVLGAVGVMTLAGSAPAVAGSQDDNSFWTNFTPSADTRLIFVSSSEGSDSNSGLTPATPIQSLARGEELLRDGYPDWLLLKRGDTWEQTFPFWSKSGRSETEMMVVGAYGDGGQRPQIRPSETGGINSQGNGQTRFVAFIGLHLEPLNRSDNQTPNGVQWYRRGGNILFEDLLVRGFANNFNLQSLSDAAPVENIRLNGCVVANSWNKQGHSQGLFAKGLDGLLIENCVFTSNGFDQNRGASPTIFNHNLYIQVGTKNVVVRDNIIADASSHGVQMRPGGIIHRNLFVSNPISALLGSNNSNLDADGASGRVTDNVIMYGRSISDNVPRSFGIDLTNIDVAVVSGNILYDSAIGPNGNAITISSTGDYGTTDLEVSRNKVINWHGSIVIDAPANGHVYRDVRLTENTVFRDLTANGSDKPLVRLFGLSSDGLTIASNRYRYFGMHNRPFKLGSDNLSVDDWSSQVEHTGDFGFVSAPPSGFGLDSYMTAIGRSGGAVEFLSAAMSQSRQASDAAFTSSAVYSWISSRPLPE